MQRYSDADGGLGGNRAVLRRTRDFWNGIIKVYCTSVQLGLKYRVWGIVLGMVMPADLVMLVLIYRITRRECAFETEKALLNKSRRDDQLCRTKYPLLLVHGVFFRDSKLMNYWGRIPAELEANGAVIFYGEQQSAASVEDSAAELAERIDSSCKDRLRQGEHHRALKGRSGLKIRYFEARLG